MAMLWSMTVIQHQVWDRKTLSNSETDASEANTLPDKIVIKDVYLAWKYQDGSHFTDAVIELNAQTMKFLDPPRRGSSVIKTWRWENVDVQQPVKETITMRIPGTGASLFIFDVFPKTNVEKFGHISPEKFGIVVKRSQDEDVKKTGDQAQMLNCIFYSLAQTKGRGGSVGEILKQVSQKLIEVKGSESNSVTTTPAQLAALNVMSC